MLEGNLVRLRAYERDDLEKARMIYNDPDVNKFLRLDVPYPLKVEDEVKWYEGLNPLGMVLILLPLKQLLMENSSVHVASRPWTGKIPTHHWAYS